MLLALLVCFSLFCVFAQAEEGGNTAETGLTETTTAESLPPDPAESSDNHSTGFFVQIFNRIIKMIRQRFIQIGIFAAEKKPGQSVTHSPGPVEQRILRAATCSAEGICEELVLCAYCGKELQKTVLPIEKLSHTSGEATVENEIPATCKATGIKEEAVYCTVCGEEVKRTVIVLPQLAPKRFLVTELQRLPGFYQEDGSLLQKTTSASHWAPVAVNPGQTCYLGYNNSYLTCVGAFFDENGEWIAPLYSSDLQTVTYHCSNGIPGSYRFEGETGSGYIYPYLYKFEVPEGAYSFSYNLSVGAYYYYRNFIASMPVFAHTDTGNFFWTEETAALYDQKKDTSLCIIGPSTVMIDRALRPVEGKNEYIVGYQEYLQPFYKEVRSFGYSGKGYMKNGENGIWDYVIGGSVPLAGYDEFLIPSNTNATSYAQTDITLSPANGGPVYNEETGATVWSEENEQSAVLAVRQNNTANKLTRIFITAGNAGTELFFFTDNPAYAAGEPITTLSEKRERETVAPNETRTVEIPADCEYVTVATMRNGIDVSPAAITAAYSNIGAADSSDPTDMCGAVNALIDYILSENPDAAIYLSNPQLVGPYYTTEGDARVLVRKKYDLMTERIQQMAELHGLPLIDLRNNLDFTEENFRQYTYDGLHMNHLGNQIVGEYYRRILLGF